MLYTISYDFSGDAEERQRLESTLASLGNSIRCLESTWLVISDQQAGEIIDALKESVSSQLYCLITEVCGVNNSWILDGARGSKKWRLDNNVQM